MYRLRCVANILFFWMVLMFSNSMDIYFCIIFFFSSRRRHTRSYGDWSSDVCSSDLARDPVVASQCLVHESVIRIEQIDHIAVLAKDAVEQQFSLAAKRLAQVVVECARLDRKSVV